MTNVSSEHGCLCPRYPEVVSNQCPVHRGEFNAAMARHSDWERPQRASHSENTSTETYLPEPAPTSPDSAQNHALNTRCEPGVEVLNAHDDTTRNALETLIDRHGLGDVLGFIAEVCAGKAEHFREKRRDAGSAQRWERSADAVDQACTVAVRNGT